MDPSGPYALNYLPLAHVCPSGISFPPFLYLSFDHFILPLSNTSFYPAPPPRPPPQTSLPPSYLFLPASPLFIWSFMCFLDTNLAHIKSSDIDEAAGKSALTLMMLICTIGGAVGSPPQPVQDQTVQTGRGLLYVPGLALSHLCEISRFFF